MRKLFEDLKNGVVLAELGGYGNGPYCAEHGTGGALVIMGTYIIDSSDNVPYPPTFVFKPGRPNYGQYLCEHISAARRSGAKVGVSAISVELKDTIDFFVAAQEAGADYVSLCAYSVMEMFTSRGLGCELCRRQNWPKLKIWVGELSKAVTIPFIFKLGVVNEPDAIEAVEIVSDMGVPIIHAVTELESLTGLKTLVEKCQFLIGGGGVIDFKSAQRILSVGVGAVSVATAAMKNSTFVGRLQTQLRNRPIHESHCC